MTTRNQTFLTLVVATTRSACAGAQSNKAVGMANPASTYCIEQGGKMEMRKDETGAEYAMCYLPNGKVIEEWDFFRSKNAQ